MAKKILVTGSAGFVGYHLCKNLLDRGDFVVGIDNINNYYDPNLKFARLDDSGIEKAKIDWHLPVISNKYPNYSFIRMNLEDKKELISLCEKEEFDIIIHLAAQAGVRYSIENPDAYVQSNIVGFLNILEVSRNFKIKHLVYASSSSVYGMNSTMPFSVKHNVDHPISLYAATKKSNELMAHTYSHLYRVPTSALRFFTVYGPWGRPDMAYFLFADAIKDGRSIKVFNNGKMKRDFTYIDDIVQGILSVSDSPATPDLSWNSLNPNPSTSTAPYRVYNIGNNSPVQLMDFINTIGEAMGKAPAIEMLPMQPGDVESTWADIEDLEYKFAYSPNTTIDVGISKFVTWYKAFYK